MKKQISTEIAIISILTCYAGGHYLGHRYSGNIKHFARRMNVVRKCLVRTDGFQIAKAAAHGALEGAVQGVVIHGAVLVVATLVAAGIKKVSGK